MDDRKDGVTEFQSRLKNRVQENEKRLKRQVPLFESCLAQWAILVSRLGIPTAGSQLSCSEIRQVNERYQALFPATLPEQAHELLLDPDTYRTKVDSYHQRLPANQAIAFLTGNDFDSLAEEDPLRIQEELFVLQGLLQCEALPAGGRFNLVDLGSGSGRLTRSLGKTIAGIMPRERVTIAGLDIDRENIMAGLGNRNGSHLDYALGFVQGDLLHPPFRPETFSFCALSSVLQLIPFQRRVLLLKEVVGCLKTGGHGVLTGPNEKCTIEGFIRSTFAAYPEVYLNPSLSLKVVAFTPLAKMIDRLSRERADYSYPDTREMCEVLKMFGCHIHRVETWPRYYPNEDIFSGICFQKVSEPGSIGRVSGRGAGAGVFRPACRKQA